LNTHSEKIESSVLKRDDVISKLIHQIRNPLATIIISASQISMKTDDTYDDDDRMLIGFINSEADRIEQLLAKYSKLINTSHLIPKEADLESLIEDLEAKADQYEDHDIKLEFENDKSTHGIRVHVDSYKMAEAFAQILENGIEQVKNNKGKIKISGSYENGRAKISFIDNGPGIRPEELRKVKEPFYSTKDGGSGLGLTIASRIATAHGGELKIDSTDGCETEVSVLLPCK